jgi:hypothetical protein
MMHPDHLALIYRIMNYGMGLICAGFVMKIIKGFWEAF